MGLVVVRWIPLGGVSCCKVLRAFGFTKVSLNCYLLMANQLEKFVRHQVSDSSKALVTTIDLKALSLSIVKFSHDFESITIISSVDGEGICVGFLLIAVTSVPGHGNLTSAYDGNWCNLFGRHL